MGKLTEDIDLRLIAYTVDEDTEEEVYDFELSREDYVKAMEEQGFTVRYPKPDELLIDIDTRDQAATF